MAQAHTRANPGALTLSWLMGLWACHGCTDGDWLFSLRDNIGSDDASQPQGAGEGSVWEAPVQRVRVEVLDRDTGRGVPLVELETQHHVVYVSDSAGVIALEAPLTGAQEVYFGVHAHGYALLDERGQAQQGIRLWLDAGRTYTLHLQRGNVAERLYRITGEGIYRDSLLLGDDVPDFAGDEAPADVYGQDSVVSAIYHGELYWFWGDTKRRANSIALLQVAGAVSGIPEQGAFDPEAGVPLRYFTDEAGGARAMLPLEGTLPVWLTGLMVIEEAGHERMLAHYSQMRRLGDRVEHGIAVWNDEREEFEKYAEFALDEPLHPNGHPVMVPRQGQTGPISAGAKDVAAVGGRQRTAEDSDAELETYVYFGNPFLHTRVVAQLDHIADPSQYEAYTCLRAGIRATEGLTAQDLERDTEGRLVWGWKRATAPVSGRTWRGLLAQGAVSQAESRTVVVDGETGQPLDIHSGTIAWNAHRKRWVLLALERNGHSPLGEVWYAEARTSDGPWSPARRIVTHDDYSFYNLKQHTDFAREGDRYLYFEGTYTAAFSGNARPTPRYDYNQIMYRLDLDDPRLSRH